MLVLRHGDCDLSIERAVSANVTIAKHHGGASRKLQRTLSFLVRRRRHEKDLPATPKAPPASPDPRVAAASEALYIMAVRRDKCGSVIGQLNAPELVSLGRMLALMIGVAD